LIKKVDSKDAEGVTIATIALLASHQGKVLTITSDNGKEFAGHEAISQALNAPVCILRQSLLFLGAWT